MNNSKIIMGYDDEKMREIYEEEYKKEMKLDQYYNDNFNDLKDKLISENFQELREHLISKNEFLQFIINSKYREIKVLKDKRDFIYVEGKLYYSPKDVNFDYLQKKYPNANIEAVNYQGTLMRYIVTEKAKLEKYI